MNDSTGADKPDAGDGADAVTPQDVTPERTEVVPETATPETEPSAAEDTSPEADVTVPAVPEVTRRSVLDRAPATADDGDATRVLDEDATRVVAPVPAAGEETAVVAPPIAPAQEEAAAQETTQETTSGETALEETALVDPPAAPAEETVVAAAAPVDPAPAAAPPTIPPTIPPGSSPLDDLEGEKPSRRGRAVGIGAGIAVVVLAGAYVAGVLLTQDRTPSEAYVAGVDVSGLPSAEAVAVLDEALGSRTREPIAISVGEVDATIDPTTAGLTFDAEASVAQLTGAAWNPADLWTRLAGSAEAEAVTSVDAELLDASLAEAEAYVDVPPVDATIAFAGTEAVVSDPVDGNALDRPAAVEVLTREWLTAQAAIELPIVVVPPALDQAAVDAATTAFVDPLLSGPVTVAVGEQSAQLDVATLTGAASVTGEDGAFVLALDPERITEAVTQALPDVGQAAKDAAFTFTDGRPIVVPSEDGTGIDPAQLLTVVQAAATSTSDRTAVVELVTAEAEFSTADAEAAGVTEVIGEFSTPLPSGSDAARTGNIAEGARRATGTLLQPGETFSLIETIGPINAYDDAGVVVNGRLDKASGGGLSQLSTTIFNAAFEAGLEDTEHRPHTRFYSRYPEGREATVWETGGPDEVDMKFTNRTEHAVVVQAWVADGQTWARVWGTPTFDTEIVTGGRYAATSSRTIYDTSAGCRPESGGQNGFSVDVTRTVKRLDGSPVEEKTYSWTYVPVHRIVCGPDPATVPPPAPEQPSGEGEG